MNKAQQAIRSKMEHLLSEVTLPIDNIDFNVLVKNLSNVKSDSIWGHGIRRVFEIEDLLTRESQIHLLIEQLASQCIDDPFTMSCVVGHKTMILLLRTTVNS